MIKNGDVVGYGNKGDFRGVVLEHILLIFAGKAMVGLVKLPSKIKVSKTAVSDTLDSNSHNFVSALINSNLKDLEKIKPVVDIKGKIIVKPLYLFLDREVLLYAKLKKLKFKEGKIKKNNICSFIDKLEQKHPEVKSAVIKGYIESFS
ncbi:MAG: hypothetical protein KKA64_04580 [Nanoarchaeota archaeon]|nr:hypothetical protein [Nanoarchaeota archaeon]